MCSNSFPSQRLLSTFEVGAVLPSFLFPSVPSWRFVRMEDSNSWMGLDFVLAAYRGIYIAVYCGDEDIPAAEGLGRRFELRGESLTWLTEIVSPESKEWQHEKCILPRLITRITSQHCNQAVYRQAYHTD